MSIYFKAVPYFCSTLLVIGIILLFRSIHDRFSNSQLRRLQKFYPPPEGLSQNTSKKLVVSYFEFIKKQLAYIGYEDRYELFFSLLKSIFFFFLASFWGLFFLSGFSIELSFIRGTIAALVSLLIPHALLWYLKIHRKDLIIQELYTVSAYIADAIGGSEKSLVFAIKESLYVADLLVAPLERFLNRYRNQTLSVACNHFLLEVPIPEAEQFIFLIANGLEYKDKDSFLEYIRVIHTTKHNLFLASRNRRIKQRDLLYLLLSAAPTILFIFITIYSVYQHVGDVLSNISY